jgi:hypothetical protein
MVCTTWNGRIIAGVAHGERGTCFALMSNDAIHG